MTNELRELCRLSNGHFITLLTQKLYNIIEYTQPPLMISPWMCPVEQLDDLWQELVEDGHHSLLVSGEESVDQVAQFGQDVDVFVVLVFQLLFHVGIVVFVGALLVTFALAFKVLLIVIKELVIRFRHKGITFYKILNIWLLSELFNIFKT